MSNNMIKNFYTVSDFYNFIKNNNDPSGRNTPATNRFHVLVPYLRNMAEYEVNNIFTVDNLMRMQMTVQKIKLPNFSASSIDKDVDVNTPIGNWSTPGNSLINTGRYFRY